MIFFLEGGGYNGKHIAQIVRSPMFLCFVPATSYHIAIGFGANLGFSNLICEIEKIFLLTTVHTHVHYTHITPTYTHTHTFTFSDRRGELNENTNLKALKQHETLSYGDRVAMYTMYT